MSTGNKIKQVVFLGSKPIGYDCLIYLIKKQRKLKINLLGVLTNNNNKLGSKSDIISLCSKHKISIIKSLNDLPKYIDILISVQYHQILKQSHLKSVKELAINLHMAPLPEYRGCNQFSFALANEEKEFGTTIHKIEEGIDSGDVLFSDRFKIPDNCWVEELYELTYKKSLDLFTKNIAKIIKGDYILTPQNSKKSQLYLRKDINKLKQINLSWSKTKIERHIRATSFKGFPYPYTFIDGKKINLVYEHD